MRKWPLIRLSPTHDCVPRPKLQVLGFGSSAQYYDQRSLPDGNGLVIGLFQPHESMIRGHFGLEMVWSEVCSGLRDALIAVPLRHASYCLAKKRFVRIVIYLHRIVDVVVVKMTSRSNSIGYWVRQVHNRFLNQPHNRIPETALVLLVGKRLLQP